MAIRFNPNKYSTASTTEDFYSDFRNNLDIHPATGDALRVRNEAAIVQSVQNLLMTNFYERPFQPMVGSRVQQNLFEPLSEMTAQKIKVAIKDTLTNYEPRVSILETIIQPNYEEDAYTIQLKLALINSINPITVDFFLNRIR